MNPHQKPQEDVVVTQEDIAKAEQWRFIEGRDSEHEGDFVTDLAADFARHRLLGHEAGRRDMREAAAIRTAYVAGFEQGWEFSRDESPSDAAESYAAGYLAALPTEHLGGEG